MNPTRPLAVLLAAAACACQGGDGSLEAPAPNVRPRAEPTYSTPPQGPGRLAVEPKAETLAVARSTLPAPGLEPLETTCGPYLALTSAPAEYLEVCRALAERLDDAYEDRFGVTLPHPAAGVILIFGSAEGFSEFGDAFGRLRPGYAGFTMASRGVVATLAQDVALDRFATVLGHELTHLAHRRVLGFNLEPWLSEGLADALGDTATTSGFATLRGIERVEPLASRLQLAIAAGRAESIGSVIAKTRATFDRGVVSYDYETSALLVRFLLLDDDLGPLFRQALRRRASPDRCSTECFLETLGTSAAELDRSFRRWLIDMTDGQS